MLGVTRWPATHPGGGGGGEMGEVIRDKLQPDGPRGSYADFTLHS